VEYQRGVPALAYVATMASIGKLKVLSNKQKGSDKQLLQQQENSFKSFFPNTDGLKY
jgi:hypothetical protein